MFYTFNKKFYWNRTEEKRYLTSIPSLYHLSFFSEGRKSMEEPSSQRLNRPLTKDEIQELLRRSVSNNDVDGIKKAVEEGANVNKDNPEVSGTPLHLAAEQGRLEAAEALLELGADIEIYSAAWASTPLGAAAWCDRCEMVRFLLTRGAAVNKVDHDGHTAMHFAASNGCVECVQLLRDHGAEARVVAEYGWTPLHEAASVGSVPVVELLLSWGAELNAVDSFGQTPLGCAVSYNRHAVMELLKDKGGFCKFDNKGEAREAEGAKKPE